MIKFNLLLDPQPVKSGVMWEFEWGAGTTCDYMPVVPGHTTAKACPIIENGALISNPDKIVKHLELKLFEGLWFWEISI